MITEEAARALCGDIGTGLMYICAVLWAVWFVAMYRRYRRHEGER